MRLPEFFKTISPVGETLTALDSGVEELHRQVQAENDCLVVPRCSEAGLALWEADYDLPRGETVTERRAAIRAAMSEGRPATPEELRRVCVTVGGFDRGEVAEDFPNDAVTVTGVTENRLPPDTAVLKHALARLCPAHLRLTVGRRGDISGTIDAGTALHGGVLWEFWA